MHVHGAYAGRVPGLWKDTIEEHRRSVREATLDAVGSLVTEHGLPSITMSQIAEAAGIGRATLYKYFSDVDAVLLAWHERQVTEHLRQLARIRDDVTDVTDRLRAVLAAYAEIRRQQHSADLAVLHRGDHIGHATRQVRGFIRDLVAEGAARGDIRDDVKPDELAGYCFHALAAAGDLTSSAAVRRLVTVILAGLRPAS